MKNPKDLLITSQLLTSTHTANEVIEKIRREDYEGGMYRTNIHFYTHLNKRFNPLKKAGLIIQVGTKKGPSNRDEKKWALTKLGESLVLEAIEQQDQAA